MALSPTLHSLTLVPPDLFSLSGPSETQSIPTLMELTSEGDVQTNSSFGGRSQLPPGKKRSTRACDQCRKTKSRCDLSPDGGKCTNCDSAGIECTVSGPSRKRGPPKGYLHAVETRLHEAEALIGIMLSVPDQRIKSFLDDISKDSFAQDILARVNSSAFGPEGRQASDSRTKSPDSSGPSRMKDLDPFVRGPTNEWQDKLISKLTGPRSPSAGATHQDVLGPTANMSRGVLMEESSDYRGSDFEKDDISAESDDSAVGQLSMDGYDQFHFHGQASGLYLLNKAERVDSWNTGGLWRITQTEHATADTAPLSLKLPEQDVQQHLLELYFNYAYPSLPIIAREQFWKSYRAREKRPDASPPDAFDILLLSVLAIAARRSPTGSAGIRDSHGVLIWEAGDDYSDQAKALIDHTYHQSHPSICQALLLLGVREFGMGATAAAWMYVGMAIRMAQDLGLHRSADYWQRNGKNAFTDEENRERRRIWYGCVKIDKYMSVIMGSPVTIKGGEFDTRPPDEIAVEEMETWNHHPTQVITGPYMPIPGHCISCFNHNTSLSLLVGKILGDLYPIRTIKSSSKKIRLARGLERQLTKWLHNLPPHLQISTKDAMCKMPPHILMLHTEYWCSVVLLHRPFLREVDTLLSPELAVLSSEAWEKCLAAAQYTIELIKAWKSNFLFRNSFPFYVFDIFQTGLIWVAALTMRPYNEQYLPNLDLCLNVLEEMQFTHPAAARLRQLLLGAKIPRREQTSVGNPTMPRESFSRAEHPSPQALQPASIPDTSSHYATQLLLWGQPGASADPLYLQ